MYNYSLLMFRFPTKESADAMLEFVAGIYSSVVVDAAVLHRNDDGEIEIFSANAITPVYAEGVAMVKTPLVNPLGIIGSTVAAAVAGVVVTDVVVYPFNYKIPWNALDRFANTLPLTVRHRAALIVLAENHDCQNLVNVVAYYNPNVDYLMVHLHEFLSSEIHERHYARQ